jgi:uncharacterized delta-60 repeat protein
VKNSLFNVEEKFMKNKKEDLIWILILLATAFAQQQAAFGQIQGKLDPTFNNGFGTYQDTLNAGIEYFRGDAYTDGTGRFAVAGYAYNSDIQRREILVRRFLSNGTPDASFGTGGAVTTTFFTYDSTHRTDQYFQKMKVQPDGKIVVASRCFGSAPEGQRGLGDDLCLVRYNQNGTLDTGFGGNTVVVTGGSGWPTPSDTYQIPPGKVWTYTGTNTVPTQNGWNAGGFSGVPNDIQIGADGRIYVFGESRDRFTVNGNNVDRFKGFVAIYSPNGTLQSITSLFDIGNGNGLFGSARAFAGAVRSDGGFVAVGSQSIVNNGNVTCPKWTVWNNSNNPSFLDAGGGSCQGEAGYSVRFLRSNKFIVGGSLGGVSGAMARYNGDGTLDTTFGINGIHRADGSYTPTGVYRGYVGNIVIVGIQNDGKIVAATDIGQLNGRGTDQRADILRFNPNGLPDRSISTYGNQTSDPELGRVRTTVFNAPGSTNRVYYYHAFLKPDGRIVGVGGVENVGRGGIAQIAAYQNKGGIFSDFDNDGRADLSVFRGGNWFVSRSFNNQFSAVQFGLSTDALAPADYDGDGRTDYAVFRNGVWYILQSSNNQFRAAQWGVGGDMPTVGDYDGDSKSDFAVFRSSNGAWYVLRSSDGGVSTTNWGQSGDRAVPGDYDNDGRNDYAVYRAGTWYVLRSADNSFFAAQFGIANDTPIEAAYLP